MRRFALIALLAMAGCAGIIQYDTPAITADLVALNADTVQAARDAGDLVALAADAQKYAIDWAKLQADIAAAKAAGQSISSKALAVPAPH